MRSRTTRSSQHSDRGFAAPLMMGEGNHDGAHDRKGPDDAAQHGAKGLATSVMERVRIAAAAMRSGRSTRVATL